MVVEMLLSRLAKVKVTGKGTWLACCPAHGDKHPSLTLRALDDGRILLHCFAGCGAADVMGSLGLSLEDLYPEPLAHHKPAIRQPFSPSDVLRALRYEAGIIAIAASDIADGKEVDQQRIALATARIADAAEYINAA